MTDHALNRMECQALVRRIQGRTPKDDKNYASAMAKLIRVGEKQIGTELRLPVETTRAGE